MITKPTVFVIGAGASAPYGFPVGWKLLRELQTCELPSDGMHGLEVEQRQLRVESFRHALQRCAQPSIDAFLEDRQDMLNIGKQMIAASLIKCERPAAMFNHDNDDHWMEYLFQCMKQEVKVDDFAKNRVGFIVYNYDRCVEHFLATCLASNKSGMKVEDAWEIVKNIPIIHPHGLLAPYVPFEKEGFMFCENARVFHSRVTRSTVDIAAKHIALYWEPSADREEKRRDMHDLIASAERIVFLGFGYHKSNLSHFLDTIMRSKSILSGTCLGTPDIPRAQTEAAFGGRLQLYPHKCRHFLSHYVPLE